MTTIYVLTEPTGEPRYVGLTTKTVEERLELHLRDARQGVRRYVYNWLRSLLANGELPKIQVLEVVEGDGAQQERKWIASGKAQGWRLTNLTEGGDGTAGYAFTTEVRQRMSIAHRGFKHSDEARLKMSAAMKGRVRSADHCKKISEANRGKAQSASQIEKRVSQLRGRKNSAEARQRMSDAAKARWANAKQPNAMVSNQCFPPT